MIVPPTPPDEAQRLASLRSLKILDTPPEERFDRITRTAARLFNAPIALVSLVDKTRQWFKSCYGLASNGTDRDISFCTYAIMSSDLFVVPDALLDERFADNPLVIGEPFIRFYAGRPLAGPDGRRLGTLCVIDTRPRHLSDDELQALRDLGDWAESELNAMETGQLVTALRASETRLQALVDNMLDAVLTVDARGVIESFNPAAERMFGYDQLEVVGQHFSTLLSESDYKEFRRVGVATIVGSARELTARRKDDSLFSVEVSLSQMQIDGQKLFTAICRDITDRKQIVKALREQEEFNVNLLRYSAVATVVINARHEVIFWNKAVEELTGVAAQEVIGTSDHWKAFYDEKRPTLGDILLDNAYDKLPQYYDTYAQTSTLAPKALHAERWFADMNGKSRFVVFDACPVYSSRGDVVAAITTLHDFTEHKRIEEALSESEDRFRMLIENTDVGILLQGPKSEMLLSNQSALDLLGLTDDQLRGKTSFDPDWRVTHEDGTDFPGETHPVPRAIATREPVRNVVMGVYRPISQNWRWLLVNAVPQLAPDGGVSQVICSFSDITRRKEVERLKNEFISTVSHELRTPLTSIRGSLGLVVGGVAGEVSASARTMLDIAYKNSERLVRLINDILDVEKIESGRMEFQLKPLKLQTVLEQAIEANRGYAEQYGVSYELVETLSDVVVNVDNDRLNQVITNLLSNAAKFSPPGGKIILNLTEQANGVRVSVSDSGPGIPEEFRQRIFQKFAQADSSDTRQKGGTGLGLSISKAIIEKLGGSIGFETHNGTGTTFYFDLPIWHSPLAASEAEEFPAPPTRRILICEDDRDIANLLSMMLSDEGFEADIALNSAQARQMLLESGVTYAAMTLDLMLPDRDGISFIRELREQPSLAELPIIVVSAQAERGRQELNGSAIAVLDWINKPIDQFRLVTAVRHAAQRSDNGQPCILHVEDDPDIVRVVAGILHDVADLTGAATLEEARQHLEQQRFDLIILDAGLPDGSGLDLLSYLNRYVTPPVPVVVFSAREVSHDMSQQVAAALVKSRHSNQELVDTIKSLIRRREPGDS